MKREVIYNVKNLHCGGCAAKIEDAVGSLSYVENANLNFMKKTLLIELKEIKENLLEELNKLADKLEPGTTILEVEEEDFTEEYVEPEKNIASSKGRSYKEEIKVGIALFLFFLGTFGIEDTGFKLTILVLAYIVSGGDVVLRSFKNIARGNVFDENFLMTIATFGAFFIGEHSEAVGVMLFYQIGEYFQGRAVNNSRKSIEGLMDIRPDFANIKIGNEVKKVKPESVKVGAVIVVKPGEKIPLDGVVISGNAALDTSALTGEALPVDVKFGDNVLSGSINKNGVIEIEVKKDFYHSTVSKILELVENASNKKAETEKFITKFAKYYTPAVVFVAAMTVIIPPLFGGDFNTWLYRALIFLVISCPCALVISIPLGFFSGIGAASKKGILIKGGNHLEALNKVHAVVFDKTGTITKGNFKVTEVVTNGISKEELLYISAHGEIYSNHPIAKSIVRSYGKEIQIEKIKDYKEIEGYGVSLTLEDKKILLGNHRLMEENNIDCPQGKEIGTLVYLAVENKFKGYLVISDEVKVDSKKAISSLRELGIKTYMLTGDNKSVAAHIADKVGIDRVYAGLLPDQKVEIFEKIQSEVVGNVIFVGDGINDAPVLARADVGVAMGGIGSDAAIEAADVVIMTDELTKIVDGIAVAKVTRKIVTQNIMLVLVIKLVVMGLGLMGEATMWEAIFADVGVAILAIFNSIRILKK